MNTVECCHLRTGSVLLSGSTSEKKMKKKWKKETNVTTPPETQRVRTYGFRYFRLLERMPNGMHAVSHVSLGGGFSTQYIGRLFRVPGWVPYIVSVIYFLDIFFTCICFIKMVLPYEISLLVFSLDDVDLRTIMRIEYPAWLMVLHTARLCFKAFIDLPLQKSRASTTFGEFAPHRGQEWILGEEWNEVKLHKGHATAFLRRTAHWFCTFFFAH